MLGATAAPCALFGIGMFLPGALNSYLIDRFRRKKVCTRSILLFALLGILYPYAEHEWMLCVLRILQGALFGIALMVTGSTLVIDVTPSSRRSKANWVFAFSGALGMLVGVSAGLFFSSLLSLLLSAFSFIILTVTNALYIAINAIPQNITIPKLLIGVQLIKQKVIAIMHNGIIFIKNSLYVSFAILFKLYSSFCSLM